MAKRPPQGETTNNVTKFPGYNRRPDVLAIPAQMTERIQEAKRNGFEVHVVAVVAVKGKSGFWAYSSYWDIQPREIMAWAAYELDRFAKLEESDDPDPGPPSVA